MCRSVWTPGFSGSFIVNDSTRVDTSLNVSSLANNSTFYWRVRGKNANGGGPFSSVWSFSTLMPGPALLLPLNGSSNQPVSQTFRWNKIASATTYQLILATDSTFASGIVKNDTTLVDTTRVVSGLQNGLYYYWRVRGKNAQGAGAYSPTFHFRTIGIFPSPVVLVAPIAEASANADSTTFRWQRSTPSVTRYWLELAIDPLFNLRTIDSTVVDTSKVVHGLVDKTFYWWKVRAYNSEGWGRVRCGPAIPISSHRNFRPAAGRARVYVGAKLSEPVQSHNDDQRAVVGDQRRSSGGL